MWLLVMLMQLCTYGLMLKPLWLFACLTIYQDSGLNSYGYGCLNFEPYGCLMWFWLLLFMALCLFGLYEL
jgi:hypothetical protein